MSRQHGLNRLTTRAFVALSVATGFGFWYQGRPTAPATPVPNRSPEAAPALSPPQKVSAGRPEIILDSAGPSIFPPSWLRREIDAKAKPLETREKARSREIIGRAVAKYPDSFLHSNLRRIYVLGDLEFSQVSASGTNSREDVYIVNQGVAANFPDRWIEKVFHAEFSSIILRNHEDIFDFGAWQSANPPGFQYEAGGVEAIRKNKFSKHFDPSLHPDGFLCEYALADLENDFNCIAEQLFLGDSVFWRLVDQHPRLKAKTGLAIAFYAKLHPEFSRDYFEAFQRVQPSTSP